MFPILNNFNSTNFRSFIVVVLLAGTTFFSLSAQKDETPYVRTGQFEGTSRQAIEHIEKLSGWIVSYSSRLCLTDRTVLTDGEKTLLEHLRTVFAECTFDYQIKNNRIILRPSETVVRKLYTVSGYVSDARTGESLPSATVYNPVSYAGTVSNSYGWFSITFPEGTCQLRASYVGYNAVAKQFTLTADTVLHLNMVSTLQLKEVAVQGNRFTELKNLHAMGAFVFPIEEVKDKPALLGEADLVKNIQMLPGIQGGSEGFSGIYVRGGGPDQNLMLLDDVPVYNIGHLLGFFSIFNADAVNYVSVLKGGFPARYGGRLSSVIDVRMAEGNRDRIEGSASIGLLSSGITLKGPIVKKRAGFALFFRRTYIDAIRGLLQRNSDEKSNYFFYDFNSKFNITLNDRNRIYFSSYSGRDRYYTTYNYITVPAEQGAQTSERNDRNDAGWGNMIFALRWNRLLSNRFFANLTLSYSNYNFNIGVDRNNLISNMWSSFGQEYESGIKDINLKIDFDYWHKWGGLSKFGLQTVRHYFNPGFDIVIQLSGNSETRTEIPGITLTGWEHHAYMENEFSIGQQLNINAGMRMILFKSENRYYFSTEPRLAARFIVSPRINMRASAGSMSQFIHMAGASNISLPMDIWLPVTDKIPPERAVQATVGMDVEVDRSGMYSVSVDFYRKWLLNIIRYRESASFFDSSITWEDKLTTGSSSSIGAEIIVRKNRGSLTGWIGYTLAKTTGLFAELNGGREFPDRYDRRHDVRIQASYRFNSKFDAGAMWTFGTGTPVTLISEKYYAPELPFINDEKGLGYSENATLINGARMPAFHRLDVGANYRMQRKKTVHEVGAGVINAYGRSNPYMLYYSADENASQGTVRTLEGLSVFSFPIPYIKYTFRF